MTFALVVSLIVAGSALAAAGAFWGLYQGSRRVGATWQRVAEHEWALTAERAIEPPPRTPSSTAIARVS